MPSGHNGVYSEKRFGHQVGHVAPEGHAPELDSYPVAMKRTKSGRTSELEGSPQVSSVHSSSGLAPQSPAISTGGSSGLPGYTPNTPGLHSVAEEHHEPAELWGGYVPYRPGEVGGGGTATGGHDRPADEEREGGK